MSSPEINFYQVFPDTNEIEIDATIPTDTDATVWVLEDSTGDGVPNATDSVSISDGLDTYSIAGIEGTGELYWTHTEIPATVVEAIIDDFESGDLVEYSGSTDRMDVQSATVFEGDFALEHVVSSTPSGDNIESYEGDGLENYPEKGDTFSAWLRRVGATDSAAFAFGVGTGGIQENSFLATIGRDTDYDFGLVKWVDGNFDILDTVSTNPPTNEWVEVVIDWGADDVIDVTWLNDSGSELAKLTVTDSSHANNAGIGWSGTLASSDNEAYMDYANIL